MNLELEELEVYQLAAKIADSVWETGVSMDFFARQTVGRQFVRAADSIGANIAEGFGRYSFKENIQFCYYARGSMMETRHFLSLAKKRGLLASNHEHELSKILEALGPKLNAYIKSIRSALARESAK